MADRKIEREENAKKLMGIDNWRQNSKEGVMKIFDYVGDIELSQRLKMTENIPLLGRALKDSAGGVEELNKDVVSGVGASKKSVDSLRNKQVEALQEELRRDDTTPERRKEIQEEIGQVVKDAESHDQKHAERLGRLADQRANLVAGTSVVLGLAYAGFKKLR